MIVMQSDSYQKNQLMNKDHAYKGLDSTGNNVSPDITWSDTPGDTKSIAITIFDPDAKHGGPCPPQGDKPHHYVITVYALKDKIDFSEYEKPEIVNSKIQELKLDEGSVVSLYGRE